MSLSTASMPPFRATSSAFEPVGAEVTRKPFSFRPASSIKRMERSSSATRTCEAILETVLSIMVHPSKLIPQNRNPKREYGTGAHRTANRHRSAVQLGDLPHQGEAKTGAGNIHILHPGHAIELFKNAIDTAFRYTVPLVGDFNRNAVRGLAR